MSTFSFTEIQDLLEQAFEPGVGFEGPFPIPYSSNFTQGVEAGWQAAILYILKMIETKNGGLTSGCSRPLIAVQNEMDLESRGG